jgi:hypothetical protein
MFSSTSDKFDRDLTPEETIYNEDVLDKNYVAKRVRRKKIETLKRRESSEVFAEMPFYTDPKKVPPVKKAEIISPKSKSYFIRCLKEKNGILTEALVKSHHTREWYNACIKTSPVFKRKVESIFEETLDYVEAKLLKAVEEGNTSAIMFYLKCKGKGRGYIEKSDKELSGNIEVTIRKTVINKKQK